MSYKDECVYYQVCIDRGCPCKLVDHVVKDSKVYENFLKELEQEHAMSEF